MYVFYTFEVEAKIIKIYSMFFSFSETKNQNFLFFSHNSLKTNVENYVFFLCLIQVLSKFVAYNLSEWVN